MMKRIQENGTDWAWVDSNMGKRNLLIKFQERIPHEFEKWLREGDKREVRNKIQALVIALSDTKPSEAINYFRMLKSEEGGLVTPNEGFYTSVAKAFVKEGDPGDTIDFMAATSPSSSYYSRLIPSTIYRNMTPNQYESFMNELVQRKDKGRKIERDLRSLSKSILERWKRQDPQNAQKWMDANEQYQNPQS